MLLESGETGGYAVQALVVARQWDLGSFAGGRLAWSSRVRSGDSDCAVRAQAPVHDQQSIPPVPPKSIYLLLQAHYAGPLLLQQALVLLARRIVEGI